MKTLTIKYQIEGRQNKILDKAIREVAKELGYEWYGSGFDFTDKYRDLGFGKEE